MISADTTDMSRTDIGKRLDDVFARSEMTFLTDARDGRRWTYGAFEAAAARFAAALSAACGGKSGPRVAFVCSNSPELLILYWAMLMLNGVAMPLDALKGELEIRDMLATAEPDLVVFDSPFETEFPMVTTADLRQAAAESSAPFPGYGSLDYDHDYLVVFTSGSTGRAKGVIHSFRDLFLSAESFAARFGFGPDNVFFHNFPMAFMAGILNTFVMPLISGSQVIVGERQSVVAACAFWNRVAATGADTFWFNPTFCNLLLQLDRGTVGTDYCRGRRVVACIGTAPLDPRTKQAFEAKYGFELFESFGLSETLFISTNTPQVPRVAGSVGVILDGASVTHAQDGELMLDAPWTLRRYLRSETPCQRPFPSGDLGEIRDGNLFITGRKKDLIIKGGINVSPRKIELFLSERFPSVGNVAVVGCPDPVMGEKTVCCLVGAVPGPETRKRINQGLRDELGKDYVVDEFAGLDAFPLNVNGKIDKPALRKAFSK